MKPDNCYSDVNKQIPDTCKLFIDHSMIDIKEAIMSSMSKLSDRLLAVEIAVNNTSSDINGIKNDLKPIILGNGLPSHKELSRKFIDHIAEHEKKSDRAWGFFLQNGIKVLIILFNFLIAYKILAGDISLNSDKQSTNTEMIKNK